MKERIRIIEILAQEKGGHRNLRGKFKTIPNGWAIIPNDMETPNFPFGEVTAEEIDGVMTVTKWVAGTIPEPEETPVSEIEQIRADIDYVAIMKGVEL